MSSIEQMPIHVAVRQVEPGWPKFWRIGSIMMGVGAISLAAATVLDFSPLAGYALDGSRVWPTWTGSMILGVGAAALLAVASLSLGCAVLWRGDAQRTKWRLASVLLASLGIVAVSFGVVAVDRMWIQEPWLLADRSVAWVTHLALSLVWLVCAAISIALAIPPSVETDPAGCDCSRSECRHG